MRGNHRQLFDLQRFTVILTAILFSGCSVNAPISLPDEPLPEPILEPPPKIVVVTPLPLPPPRKPVAPAPVIEPLRIPPVAIVLTSNRPAFADVAEALTAHFDDYQVYDLSDDSRTPVAVLRSINDSDSGIVVAIGLRAARSSVSMSETPVVFSQIFNYREHQLLLGQNRGVVAFPPLAAQIQAWQEFAPGISRVGAIIGPGHDDLIEDAKLAAEKIGIKLEIKVAHSDQETQYVFKRMVHDIDGFWLFPDNRILSRRALREIMRSAQQQNVPVLVPNESMLRIGASISISSVASNIADTIAAIVRQIHAGNIDQIPLMSSLSEIRVRANTMPKIAQQ